MRRTPPLLWLLALLLLTGAGPKDELRQQAREAYQRQDFPQAAQAYAQLADQLDRDSWDCVQAARCYAHLQDAEKACHYLTRSLEPGPNLEAMVYLANEAEFRPLVNTSEWEEFHQRLQAMWKVYQKNAALRVELMAMAEEDQLGRARAKASEERARLVEEQDSAHLARLKEIVATQGWPGRDTVGRDAAAAAWLLIQHGDQQRDLQKRCLELMRPLVEQGQVSPSDFAYLTDRVLVGDHLPQRYGTQLREVEGRLELQPVEDPEHLDERRKAVGLDSERAYLERSRALLLRP